MDPEAPQPGGNHRMLIIIGIAGAIALVAYLYFRNQSGGGSPSTSGGGGSVTSGATTLDKGAVTISVTQNPQPKPPTKKKKVTHAAHNPPSVSRVNRSPAVKHKIHQIHQIHTKYEKDKGGKKK